MLTSCTPTRRGCRRRNSSFPSAVEKKTLRMEGFLSLLYWSRCAATLRSVNAIEQHFTLYSIGLIAHGGGRMRLFERLQRYPRNKFLVRSYACFILCVALCPVLLADAGTVLRDGWKVQSSAKVSASPEQISVAGFSPEGWYSTSAPKTVFAVLVENGVYKDPYFGMNLRSVPGVSYKVGGQFANDEVPDDSPYAVPWWYRKEFAVPASDKRSEEHTSELQSQSNLVCRLLLEKKKTMR